MKRAVTSLLVLLFLGSPGFAANAAPPKPVACPKPTDPAPRKTLKIVNNNPVNGASVYLFFESFIQDPKKADLWMQACFKVSDWVPQGDTYVSQRRFVTSRIRRGYVQIGNDEGIPPGGSVTISLPFYTQLLATTDANRGLVTDQYIDWWNSGRVYFFDSAAAYHSVKVTNDNGTPPAPGGGLPPKPVKVLAGADVPSCAASNGKKCTVALFENAIEPLGGIPFQLQEYTLSSAIGPPLNTTLPAPTRTTIDLNFVNYNVSSLDSVFMPVAMGPLTKAGDSVDLGVQPPVAVPYVGTDLTTLQFRATLDKFSSNGSNWPFFVPAYFDDRVRPNFPSAASKSCSLAPFTNPGTGVYNLPKLPGANPLLIGSFLGAAPDDPKNDILPPVPPVLSSNPSNYRVKYKSNACILSSSPPFVKPPNLGKAGKAFIDLWNKCYPSTLNTSVTCKDIRTVADLFVKYSYFGNKACTDPQTPLYWITMEAVYGWVPIVNGTCTGLDLKETDPNKDKATARYKEAALAYCRLQYNYVTLPKGSPDIFNPYTALIHGKYSPVLGGGVFSSAYAFSIDDALSFKHVVAEGIILTIAGTKGLEFARQPPFNQTAPVATVIPDTPAKIEAHCKLS